MAKFKPYKIESSQLENLSVSEGQFIVATDTHKVYLDENSINRIELSPSPTKTSELTNDSGFATETYVGNVIAALPDPMLFKGSIGSGGTISDLPTATAANVGFVYTVITAGTYANQVARIGDAFVSDGMQWILIGTGHVSTNLSSSNQTYYLTGVTDTNAATDTQLYSTRMSSTYTGVKYRTSTSAAGGTLTVDDRPVTLGLYYDIS